MHFIIIGMRGVLSGSCYYHTFYFPYTLFASPRSLIIIVRDVYICLNYFMCPNTRRIYDANRPINHSLRDCEPILSPRNENGISEMTKLSDKITTLHLLIIVPNKVDVTGNWACSLVTSWMKQNLTKRNKCNKIWGNLDLNIVIYNYFSKL